MQQGEGDGFRWSRVENPPFQFASDGGEVMVWASRWSPALDRTLRDTRAAALMIQPPWADSGHSLAFLAGFKDQLRHLFVRADDLPGIETISCLSNLVDLSLPRAVDAIDFGGLQQLTSVGLGPEAGRINVKASAVDNLSRCRSLRTLSLMDIQLEDLHPLNEVAQLEELSCTGTGLRTLAGLGRLSNLRKLVVDTALLSSLDDVCSASLQDLRLFYMRKLQSVRGLSQLQSLRVLAFASCRQMRDLCEVALPALESVAMIQCGDIPSLSFLRNSPALGEIKFRQTGVKDGDLRILNELRDLERIELEPFKRHYTPRFVMIADLVSAVLKRTGKLITLGSGISVIDRFPETILDGPPTNLYDRVLAAISTRYETAGGVVSFKKPNRDNPADGEVDPKRWTPSLN
jgi:hypothetical protein